MSCLVIPEQVSRFKKIIFHEEKKTKYCKRACGTTRKGWTIIYTCFSVWRIFVKCLMSLGAGYCIRLLARKWRWLVEFCWHLSRYSSAPYVLPVAALLPMLYFKRYTSATYFTRYRAPYFFDSLRTIPALPALPGTALVSALLVIVLLPMPTVLQTSF